MLQVRIDVFNSTDILNGPNIYIRTDDHGETSLTFQVTSDTVTLPTADDAHSHITFNLTPEMIQELYEGLNLLSHNKSHIEKFRSHPND